MKIIISLILLTLSLLINVKPTYAATEDRFINIVNPVRISSYTKNPGESVKAEYSEVSSRDLSATWLLTYDSFLDNGAQQIISTMDDKQEVGILLEVTPKLAEDTNVVFNKSDSWHRAESIFLSGYTQSDRIKLIDNIFESFKNKYGYYPKSVGSWWTDSFSLNYIKQKYGIIANLVVADQYSTDSYQVWGQFWGAPYYPSINHPAVPAQSIDNKLDLVNIQWAPRDPELGYGMGDASRFSTQDYFTLKLDDSYLEELAALYLSNNSNSYGQITLGLEGDFDPEVYKGVYARHLDYVLRQTQQGLVQPVTMSEFADWYRSKYPLLSENFQVEKYSNTENSKVIWYQTSKYRIGLKLNYDQNVLLFMDLRGYSSDLKDPYNLTPNRDIDLKIYLPAAVDFVADPGSLVAFNSGLFKDSVVDQGNYIYNFENLSLTLKDDSIEIFGKDLKMPNNLTSNPLLEYNQNGDFHLIKFKDDLLKTDINAHHELSFQVPYFLKQKFYSPRYQRIIVMSFFGLIVVGVVFIYLIQRRKLFNSAVKKIKISEKLAKTLVGGLIILGFMSLIYISRIGYFVSNEEIFALKDLSLKDGERVMIPDRDCLRCVYQTGQKPAAIANKREYVKEFSKKEVIKNYHFFQAQSVEEAKNILEDTKTDFIYLVKYEDYHELLPYNADQLGLVKIYENANATIWRVIQK